MKVTIEIFADFPNEQRSRVFIRKRELETEKDIRDSVAYIVMSLQKIYEEEVPMEAKISIDTFTLKHNFPNEAQQ